MFRIYNIKNIEKYVILSFCWTKIFSICVNLNRISFYKYFKRYLLNVIFLQVVCINCAHKIISNSKYLNFQNNWINSNFSQKKRKKIERHTTYLPRLCKKGRSYVRDIFYPQYLNVFHWERKNVKLISTISLLMLEDSRRLTGPPHEWEFTMDSFEGEVRLKAEYGAGRRSREFGQHLSTVNSTHLSILIPHFSLSLSPSIYLSISTSLYLYLSARLSVRRSASGLRIGPSSSPPTHIDLRYGRLTVVPSTGNTLARGILGILRAS